MSVSAEATPDDLIGGPPWLVIIVAWVAHFWRFGYSFGVSDQDEVIPQLLAHLEPGLFANDWYVQFQLADIGVRTYFVYLLELLSQMFPVEWAFGLVYLATFALVVWAIHALTVQVGGNRVAAALVVLVGLVATQGWTLGANDLTPALLIPRSLAWAVGLWAVVFALRGRYWWSGLLLGAGALMQPLVGLQMAGLTLCGLAGAGLGRRLGTKALTRVTVAFVATGLPALGPLILEQIASAEAAAPAGRPSVFFLIANFRAPHHYLPASFPRVTYEHFAALVIAGAAALAWLAFRRSLKNGGFVVGALAGVGVALAAGWVFTELVPVEFLMKFQLFNLTVPAKVLLLAPIGIVATGWVHPELTGWWRSGEGWKASALLGATLLVLSALAYFPADGPLADHYVVPGTDFPNESELYSWVRDNTPPDAVFVTPPSWDRFRSFTQRSIVVNFKAFPFEDAALFTWFDRLMAVAPVPIPDHTDGTIVGNLDAAYRRAFSDRLVVAMEEYGASYAVLQSRPPTTDARLVERFANGFGVVYELVPPR